MLQNSQQRGTYDDAIPIRAKSYMEDLSIPEDLAAQERTGYAIFLMVESSKITK